MHEAKTKLSRLVERAEAGEDIIVTRNGTPVARLAAVAQTSLLAAGPRRAARAGALHR
jgi:prevent-host-death family protein